MDKAQPARCGERGYGNEVLACHILAWSIKLQQGEEEMKQSERTLLLSFAQILVLQVEVFLSKSITFVPDAITYFFPWLDAQTSKVKTDCTLRSFDGCKAPF